MNYGLCKMCGKQTSYDRIPVCKACEDKMFLKVREYIYAHGSKTLEEIHIATNVPIKVIKYFIDNGSLTMTNMNASEDVLSFGRSLEFEPVDSKTQAQINMLNKLKKDIISESNKDDKGMLYIGRNKR